MKQTNENLTNQDLKHCDIWFEQMKSNHEFEHLINRVIEQCLDGKKIEIPIQGQKEAKFCVEQIERLAGNKLKFTFKGMGRALSKVICQKR